MGCFFKKVSLFLWKKNWALLQSKLLSSGILKKVVKILKLVSFILILLILIELFYIIHITFFKSAKSVYFDSINSFSKLSSGYVAVGSNNDNEMNLEKH